MLFYLVLIGLNIFAFTSPLKTWLGAALFYKAILILSALDLVGFLLLLRKAGMLLLKLVFGLLFVGALALAFFYLR